MKIISIVGARPNFIKMFPLTKLLDKSKHEHILVHTGQHYDINMSDIFFKEMGVRAPDYNLGVGSGTHGYQTGEMLKEIEKILIQQEPDIVIVPGDTNSTLSGSLAAAKLNIKITHLEAGLRSFNKKMPEEINRVLTDHCSDILLCPSDLAVENLRAEGIISNVHKVGDTMYELATMVEDKINAITKRTDIPGEYILATIHRAENTVAERLPIIMNNLGILSYPVVIPIHPRTKNKLHELNLLDKISENIVIIEPLGFYEFSSLMKHSQAVITDSGGVQKEAYWHKKPCVTVRDETEWLETVKAGGNILSKPDKIKNNLEMMLTKEIHFVDDLYGYKDTSERILAILEASGK
ncbi:MAG: UDP-N-acetylglucosamine 2-epimerase (non-hydrolyzing) [Asgard group archaeon]|nr:UDP-N-acetylglucosamine 2-epimerase (non-hydrolyzing) [Asgard group archaeon]